MSTFTTSLVTGLKEVARFVVFSIPGLVIIYLTNNPQVGGAYGVVILALLRAIDKAIHDNPSINANGILPF